MANLRTAMRTDAGNSNKSINEQHACPMCGAIDLTVTPNKPICRPCHQRMKQEEARLVSKDGTSNDHGGSSRLDD